MTKNIADHFEYLIMTILKTVNIEYIINKYINESVHDVNKQLNKIKRFYRDYRKAD